MYSSSIDSFAHDCDSINDKMAFRYLDLAPSFMFSNTSKPPKNFSISLHQMISVLTDIQTNLPHFLHVSKYVERTWRDRFSSYIQDPIINTLSTVQTMPLYEAINKVIHIANNLNTYIEKEMDLTETHLNVSIGYLKSQIPDNDLYIEGLSSKKISTTLDKSGINTIYYGAPGTGKSYKIDTVTSPENSVRTVFHPETQHNDFVGCLKPTMNNDEIVYSFRPGPFSLALVKACKNMSEPTYLVIEEVNRGAAAAIFGDLFLLLDREDGRSKYTIDISDPDMKAYLENNAKDALDHNGKLFIPSNLSIMATMNSSDQAVMPMDSAFKRRWEFEYIPLVSNVYPKGNLHINIPSGKIEISWKSFSTIINERLATSQHVPEDRLLGPWFLSEKEMIDEPTAKKSLASKVLMYLFDDVLRHGNKGDIFNEYGQGNFGTLITKFNAGDSIFDNSLSDLFKNEKVKDAE